MSLDLRTKSDADLLALLCGAVGRKLAKRPLAELFGLVRPRQSALFVADSGGDYMVLPQLGAAKELLMRALHQKLESGTVFTDPGSVKQYLMGRLTGLGHEVFACLWLDTSHKLIAYEEMFRGSISQASVYPREVAKSALMHNAAAVIFAHNHPSGDVKPSTADERLTQTLKSALALVDCRSVDHIIVGQGVTYSFAESGLM